ncbi:hypothetical protein LTR36_000600 [Oleoguttula mirabilis]|uniref:Mitochondrial ribosomal protein L28 n=1 Tax=Oleoguttula mirabilis TaxID=1507867 RepID=A0AAV9JQE0_9PEZI|nr:hypothetical protein LTR36_000600 [Oleoguttula mirabilis]
MNAPSMALLRAFSPVWRAESLPWVARGCQWQQKAPFSSTEQRMAKKGRGEKKDMRITLIRYHLQHPLTPRPLRFSRNRALRHWTIHRAWRLYQTQLRLNRQLELERQYNSMAAACEALRLTDNHGLTAEDRMKLGGGGGAGDEAAAAGAEGREMGRLYRIAMLKDGVWEGAPIEYARIQTESPPREGWNHAWTR